MRLHRTLLSSLALCALTACKSEEDLAREILAEALQHYAVLQDDTTSTENRLKAGQAITDALQRIVSDHATTDLGLEIAAGGTVGEMSTDLLRQQILELQDLRALELCDEQPTAICVVDRLAGDVLLKDRSDLIANVPPVPAILMALATGETDAARTWFRDHPEVPMGGWALAMAPTTVLTPQLVDTVLSTMPEEVVDQMSLLAAWRSLTGAQGEELRKIALAGGSGRAVMEIFDNAEAPDTVFAAITSDAEQQINWDNLRQAESILKTFEGWPEGSYPLSILVSKFGLEATMSAIPVEWDFAPEDVQSALGTEAAKLRVETILADPASPPRALSLALMRAPLLIPKNDLKALVAPRKEAEVMTWDNVRILPTFIALGYLGDRDLFDDIEELLTTSSMSGYLDELWDTGRQLEAGTLSQTALEDDRVFRAAVDVAAALADKETLSAVLRDGVSKISPTTDTLSRALGRDDIAVAAYACGMTAVLREIAVTDEDLHGYIGRCDRARLGTMPSDLSDEDFGFFLENADLVGDEALALIRESISLAPSRAYGFVGALQDGNRQVDLTGFLSFALARSAAHAAPR